MALRLNLYIMSLLLFTATPDIARKSRREREGPKKSVSDRVMVRETEKNRVMARNSGKEREGVRGSV